MLVKARDAVAQAGEDLVADGVGGAGPIVGGRLNVILAAARAEQFDRVALVNAEFGGGSVQVHDELVHAHAAAHAVELRTFSGHDAHRAARLLHVLGTFHIETGSGAVDAIGVAQRHNSGRGVVRGQVGAAIRDAMAGLHILDRAELRLQAHGRGQMPVARGAHRGIGLVAVQADAGAGKFEVNLRAVQSGRRVGQVTDLRRNAGLFHAAREVLEYFDLAVGGGHEFGHIGRIGHGEMAPLTHNMQHALFGERHEFGERGVESGRRETVATEAGIDLDVYAGGLAELACGGGHGIDAGQGADRYVDIGSDQLIEWHFGAVVDPSQNAATVGADAEFAQQQCFMRLRGAEPCRAAGERGQCGGQQSVAVGVGLDHTHHRRAGSGPADHGDQVGHVVAHGFEVHDGLCGVLAAGGRIVGLALLGRECDFRCCVHAHRHLLLRENVTCSRNRLFSPGSRTLMTDMRFLGSRL